MTGRDYKEHQQKQYDSYVRVCQQLNLAPLSQEDLNKNTAELVYGRNE